MSNRIEQFICRVGVQLLVRHNGNNGWRAILEDKTGKQVPFRDSPGDVGILLAGIADRPNDSIVELCKILRGKLLVVRDPVNDCGTIELPVPYDLSYSTC